MEFKHTSVLLWETIDGLQVKPDGTYVDGTLGGAGHALEVCKKLSAKGRLIGIDQDQDAIIAASDRLAAFKQAAIIRSNYCHMVEELEKLGIDRADGILLDLGVSSWQLDNEERGFSYRFDAPLDMDAAVGSGNLDLRLRNVLPYDIEMRLETQDGVMCVRIYRCAD